MKILNIGSLNIDHVYNVPHFVQPGETITALSLSDFCGGKGLNQSIAAAKAGASIFHAGIVGADGDMLIHALKQFGVDVTLVERTTGVSGHAIVEVDESGQNRIIIHGGANLKIDRNFIDSALCKFSKGDLLLLQNETGGVDYAMREASARGMKVIFNPSPMDESVRRYPLSCVDIFLLNEIEGEGITGEKESENIAAALLKINPNCMVVLTLGEQGVYYKDANMVVKQDTFDIPVVDTTGAGDTFTGYFIAGLADNLPVRENLRRACAASSIAVSRPGASPSIPSIDEVCNWPPYNA